MPGCALMGASSQPPAGPAPLHEQQRGDQESVESSQCARWSFRRIATITGVPSNKPASSAQDADREAIAGIVQTFFAAFASGRDSAARLESSARCSCPTR